MRRFWIIGVLALLAGPAAAQDTTEVRIGISYTPGQRPGLVVLPGPGLDSVRAILERDLDFSDRFEMVALGGTATASARPGVNYELYRSLGADLAVEILSVPGGATVRLHDVGRGEVRAEQTVTLPGSMGSAFRMAVHRAADEIVRSATGTAGIAATRLLYESDGRIYRVDSDGYGATAVTPSGIKALSPTWAPDGRRFAYTRFEAGSGPVVVQSIDGGAEVIVSGTRNGLNITPAFSADGRTIAYAHIDEGGTDIFAADAGGACCERRLTAGRFADNLSPTYAPDGRRIAFVSTRAGPPQVYVMGEDGTDQELLVPFDYGETGPSNAPEWSPDGTSVVFHRDVSRSPQVFVYEVARGRVRQLTSSGRNEDPTWAPDGRHVAFVSDRSGRRQIWIVDMETGRVRQLRTSGAARLPSWSRRLSGAAAINP